MTETRCGGKRQWPSSRKRFRICLQHLRKNTQGLRIIGLLSRDSNSVPLEYKPEVLPIYQTCSVSQHALLPGWDSQWTGFGGRVQAGRSRCARNKRRPASRYSPQHVLDCNKGVPFKCTACTSRCAAHFEIKLVSFCENASIADTCVRPASLRIFDVILWFKLQSEPIWLIIHQFFCN